MSKELQSRGHFPFKRTYSSLLDGLDDYTQLALYRAMTAYSFKGIEPDFGENTIAGLVWSQMRTTLRKDMQLYLNGCKGGAPVGNGNARKENNQETTKIQPKNNQETTKDNPKPSENTENDFPYQFNQCWKEMCRANWEVGRLRNEVARVEISRHKVVVYVSRDLRLSVSENWDKLKPIVRRYFANRKWQMETTDVYGGGGSLRQCDI